MTQLYTRFCHDTMFPREHIVETRRVRVKSTRVTRRDPQYALFREAWRLLGKDRSELARM